MGLSPETMSYLHRAFPTLSIALPQAVRLLPGTCLVLVSAHVMR